MRVPFGPERWAFEITHLLNAALGPDRYPLDIGMVAREYSRQRFPSDPVLEVMGGDLPGFEGALYCAKSRKGWHILYNSALTSRGRINFTLAHEFGHYLLHREKYPNGFECSQRQVVQWDSEYGQVENQANVFAANLLMPLDDFRKRLPAHVAADLAVLKDCADRYNVSLVASVLRWLGYTQKRAALVMSRDGYILWARSSDAAWRSHVYFKTVNRSPVEIPMASLAANPHLLVKGRGDIDHPAGVWFAEPVREMTLFAEQYDFSLSLLTLDDSSSRRLVEDAGDGLERTVNRFARRSKSGA